MKLKSLVVVLSSLLIIGASCSNSENSENSSKEDDVSLKNTPKNEVKEAKNVDEKAHTVSEKEPNATSFSINKSSFTNNGEVVNIKKEQFLEEVWNYEENPQTWVYNSDKPAIIDFYADWCAPCKRIAPIMKDLAKEYDGEINIYKIDTEVERELAAVFGIRSIPSILYIPTNGKPVMESGALSKQDYINRINTYLLKDNQ